MTFYSIYIKINYNEQRNAIYVIYKYYDFVKINNMTDIKHHKK